MFDLWKVEHVYYPPAIKEVAPSSSKVRDALEEAEREAKEAARKQAEEVSTEREIEESTQELKRLSLDPAPEHVSA